MTHADDAGPSYEGVPIGPDPGALTAAAGRINLAVFDQDVLWIDIHGGAHRLADMTPTYRTAVLAFLLAHQTYFWHAAMWDELANATVVDFIIHEGAGVPWIGQLQPRTWMTATALFRKLRALEAADPASG